MTEKFIGYHFFHRLGRIPPQEAYSKTERAVATFTDQKNPSFRNIVLDLRDDQEGPTLEAFDILRRKFGHSHKSMRGVSLAGPNFQAHEWSLSPPQFEESFEFLRALQERLPAVKDRVFLSCLWTFKFVEPGTSELLPGQDNPPILDIRLPAGSSLKLNMGGKASLNAWFLFPFDAGTREFKAYVAAFEKMMLFDFSPEHWRLWSFSKGEWRPRRFERSELPTPRKPT